MSFENLTPSRKMGLSQAVPFSNGVEMPWLGLGVYQMGSQEETERLVSVSIAEGYRLVDTASIYDNESGVGEAVRKCGVPREELFVTTKVWNEDIRSERVEEAFEESLERLGLDYVDLYLLHWPIEGKIGQSWLALESLYRSGRIRAIGVSNFLKHHLDEVLEVGEIKPVLNQVEYHPYLQSRDLKAYCDEHSIQLQAWSPFMHGGEILQDPVLVEIGKRHGKTSAQVIVRWILQTGVSTIPKSGRESRIVENSDVFDFQLSGEDLRSIAELERNGRSGPDPANFDF